VSFVLTGIGSVFTFDPISRSYFQGTLDLARVRTELFLDPRQGFSVLFLRMRCCSKS
jgi:hypothetical protein